MGLARPPGYPRRYEIGLTVADGRRVQVRPIRPADAPALAEAIRHADPQTVRSRFLGAAPPVTPELLRSLTEVDYVHRFALVAFDGDGDGDADGDGDGGDDSGVAVARYIAASGSPSEAEVAIVVAPAWRRVGLATQLIKLLARRAVECGITSFTALYWSQNRPVAELADDAHARVVIGDGVAELRARLVDGALIDGEEPEEPGDDLTRRPVPPP